MSCVCAIWAICSIFVCFEKKNLVWPTPCPTVGQVCFYANSTEISKKNLPFTLIITRTASVGQYQFNFCINLYFTLLYSGPLSYSSIRIDPVKHWPLQEQPISRVHTGKLYGLSCLLHSCDCSSTSQRSSCPCARLAAHATSCACSSVIFVLCDVRNHVLQQNNMPHGQRARTSIIPLTYEFFLCRFYNDIYIHVVAVVGFFSLVYRVFYVS